MKQSVVHVVIAVEVLEGHSLPEGEIHLFIFFSSSVESTHFASIPTDLKLVSHVMLKMLIRTSTFLFVVVHF